LRVSATSIFAPLRRRDFALLWTGVSVSLIGDGIYYVAVAWEAYSISNSPTALSLVGVAWTAPLVFSLLAGGSVSDRLERRKVLVCALAIQGLALASIGVLALSGGLNLAVLVGLVAVAGAAMGFFSPALGAIIPGLVAREELPAASAIEQLVRPLSLQLAGPALGGLLLVLAGAGAAFLVDAGTFAFAAVMIAALRRRPLQPAKTVKVGTLSSILDGLRFIRSNRWLAGTFLAAGLSLFAAYGPSQVLVPYVLKNELHLGGGAFGVIRALAGVGSVGAALAIGQRGLPRRFMTIMFLAWAIQALAGVGYGIAANEWGLALVSFCSGLAVAVGNVIWGTLIMAHVPSDLLGRVSSLDWLVSIGLVPASYAITGPVAAALGPRTTLIVAGSIACLIMAAAPAMPRMRDPEASPLVAG
jgi:MFS family permease